MTEPHRAQVEPAWTVEHTVDAERLALRAENVALRQQLQGAVEALRRIGEPMGNRRLSEREAQAVAKSALDRVRGQ